MDNFFFARIKRTNGIIEKGLEVKENYDAAKQSYHAYLGAYAYGHDANTDYVACYIVNTRGTRMMWEVWEKPEEPEEEEPEESEEEEPTEPEEEEPEESEEEEPTEPEEEEPQE